LLLGVIIYVVRVYEEIIGFIAAGSSPRDLQILHVD